jgi:hypothetical protein
MGIMQANGYGDTADLLRDAKLVGESTRANIHGMLQGQHIDICDSVQVVKDLYAMAFAVKRLSDSCCGITRDDRALLRSMIGQFTRMVAYIQDPQDPPVDPTAAAILGGATS